MAKMNGLEVKALEYVLDHEGFAVPKGNLYYQNKKVGEFQADFWAGPMHYTHTSEQYTEDDIRNKVSEIAKLKGWDPFYDNFEIIIHELIDFKELESTFKDVVKKDCSLVVMHVDRRKRVNPNTSGETVMYQLPNSYTSAERDSFFNDLREEYPERILVEYKSLEDFVQ